MESALENIKQGDKAGASAAIDEMRRQSEQEGNAQADLLKSMIERFKQGDFGGLDRSPTAQPRVQGRPDGGVGRLSCHHIRRLDSHREADCAVEPNGLRRDDYD